MKVPKISDYALSQLDIDNYYKQQTHYKEICYEHERKYEKMKTIGGSLTVFLVPLCIIFAIISSCTDINTNVLIWGLIIIVVIMFTISIYCIYSKKPCKVPEESLYVDQVLKHKVQTWENDKKKYVSFLNNYRAFINKCSSDKNVSSSDVYLAYSIWGDYDVVKIGSEIKILNLESNKEEEYTIVLRSHWRFTEVSFDSPFAAAVLLHEKGDTVFINAPGGDYFIKIVDISSLCQI